jgi:23S rRNA pseudouridine1911/1915/1917 synthase
VTPPRELVVPPEAAGTRLDAWLARALAEVSRAAAAGLIDSGAVSVDGERRPKSTRLQGGEHVRVEDLGPDPGAEPPLAPAVVWEGDTFVVVDKPPGIVVHPAPGHRGVTLVEWLARRSPGWEPHAVHRLDRDTSGLMLVAKGEEAQRELQAALRRREVLREYLALVTGRPSARTGTIDAPLGRDVRRRTRMSTRTDTPREARTHFEVERFAGAHTLVRARLETGRTHQIRAHFAAIGHPLAGDREYGARDELGLKRQFLHSARLALPVPPEGTRREWRSNLPPDLATALERALSSKAG